MTAEAVQLEFRVVDMFYNRDFLTMLYVIDRNRALLWTFD